MLTHIFPYAACWFPLKHWQSTDCNSQQISITKSMVESADFVEEWADSVVESADFTTDSFADTIKGALQLWTFMSLICVLYFYIFYFLLTVIPT